MERLPTEAEWNDWRSSPVTQGLMRWAQSKRQGLMNQWADGNFTDVFQSAMAIQNASATGACSVYSELAELDYLTLLGEFDDSKQVRPEASGQSGSGEDL